MKSEKLTKNNKKIKILLVNRNAVKRSEEKLRKFSIRGKILKRQKQRTGIQRISPLIIRENGKRYYEDVLGPKKDIWLQGRV